MENNDEGLLAVVTGASSGIGYELAKVFARNGFDLVIAAEDDGIAEAASVIGTHGTRVDYLQVDLATEEGVGLFYEKIREQGKPVEALAINAGVGVGGEFISTPIEKEVNLINLNILSAVRLTKLVLQDMAAVGHGRILFTSSLAAEMPGPYYAVYAASKAFLQSFAEALRVELTEEGITVTALQPGATATNFFVRAGMTDTKAGKAPKDDPAEVAQDGFDALMSGRDHVIAGSFKNKMRKSVGKILSQVQGAKMQGKQVKPGAPTESR